MNHVETLGNPLKFGSIEISNRFVAQPMERTGGDENGALIPDIINDYLELARGNWGTIIMEAMTVTDRYKSRKCQLVINEKNSQNLHDLVQQMRKIAPDTKIIFQLTFPGVISNFQKTTIIPSIHEDDPSIKLLGDDEIGEISSHFKNAIDISMDLGVDGVDIKACHGYMGIEFLRPLNQRAGKYGGSFENRIRFFIDLYKYTQGQVKARGLEGFLIGSRVSIYEAIQGGFGTSGPGEIIEDLSEPCKFAEQVHDHGANYINVTAGIPARMPELTRPSKSAPFGIFNHFRLTKTIKDHLEKRGKKMIVIGSAYSMLKEDLPRYAAGNVESCATDLVGLGRQILADPAYPKKYLSGKKDTINYCIGCNLCAKLLVKQRYVGCANYYDKFKKNLKD
ncbi:MAG: hypothetical protein ACFFCS_14540 [Candidatus Hodarchaeota archaeon]